MIRPTLLTLPVLLVAVRAQYSATYLPPTVPPQTEPGQIGTNQCGTVSSQTSLCQNVYVNSVEDFCLWAPPYSDGKNSTVGVTEDIVVSWCTKSGYGTRLIPDDTLLGAHFVQTPDYVQVTGWGDFTKMNIPEGDLGGELDPHGADGRGNPHGGLVFGNSFGQMQQYHEWTNFMSATAFCIRACKDGPNAAKLCNHIYDVLGCGWNMPGNYDQGVFENCLGDTAEPMGIYGTSTFYQGEPTTPPAHPPPASSECKPVGSLANGGVTYTTPNGDMTTSSSTSTGDSTPTSSPIATSSVAATSSSSYATSHSPVPTSSLVTTRKPAVTTSHSSTPTPAPSGPGNRTTTQAGSTVPNASNGSIRDASTLPFGVAMFFSMATALLGACVVF